MGTFTWPLRVSDMDGQRSIEIEATVDTGAAYTTLPGRLLRELGSTAGRPAQVSAGRRSANLPGLRRGLASRSTAKA